MMTFEEFAQKIQEALEEALGNVSVKVSIIETLENNAPNGLGVMIKNEIYNIAPVIHLQNFYQEYIEGRLFSNIVNRIREMYQDKMPEENFDLSHCLDFERAKDNIVARLYGTENNASFLAGKPYTLVEDLVVTYYIHLGFLDGGKMSIPITDHLLEHYGISKEELHELAMKNTQKIFPAKFQSMQEFMTDLMREDIMREFEISEKEAEALIEDTFYGKNLMYMLSNTEKMHGAISILQPEIIDMIAEQLGEHFYVIPSSIHECIIMPFDDSLNFKDLEQMVKDVNLTEVAENEILSWHMYQVDAKNHVLLRCDRAKEYERQMEEQEKLQKEKNNQVEKQEKEVKKISRPRI